MQINSIKSAEFARNVFAVVVPAETKIADILAPHCWTHIASKLQRGDRVEIYPEDGKYFAELIVVSAGKNWAQVVLAREIPLDVEATSEMPSDEYYITYGSPSTLFRVHRKSDKKVLKDGFENKKLAQAWIDETFNSALAKAL